MERLAVLHIIEQLAKNEVDLTFRDTPYKYADIRIEYLVEYKGLNHDYTSEYKTVHNVKLSQTRLNRIFKGEIFIINEENIIESQEKPIYLNDFASRMNDFIQTPLYEDKFILDIKSEVSFLFHEYERSPIDLQLLEMKDSSTDLNSQKYEERRESIIEYNKVVAFKKTLKENKTILDNLDEKIESSINLYYDVYDVDGYLSIITDDISFEMYLDIGDYSGKYLPKKADPFIVFVSHWHADHYNVINTHSMKAEHYILPYRGSIIFKGKSYYSASTIQIISTQKSRVSVILTGTPTPANARNVYSFSIESKYLKILIPKYSNFTDPNLESMSVEIKKLHQSVFYPGDTKNYMYYPYMKTFNYFIASHHGGDVGAPNFGFHTPDNVIINTFSKNISTAKYNKNVNYYSSHSGNLIIHSLNNGLKGTRITIK